MCANDFRSRGLVRAVGLRGASYCLYIKVGWHRQRWRRPRRLVPTRSVWKQSGAILFSEFQNGFRSLNLPFGVRKRISEFEIGFRSLKRDFAIQIRFSELENRFRNSGSIFGVYRALRASKNLRFSLRRLLRVTTPHPVAPKNGSRFSSENNPVTFTTDVNDAAAC